MLFSTALNGMGVARLRYYSAIRYAVKAPQENTMAKRTMSRAQWNFMAENTESMMRTVMPEASARSDEPINGWTVKKVAVVKPLSVTLADLAKKENE